MSDPDGWPVQPVEEEPVQPEPEPDPVRRDTGDAARLEQPGDSQR
ncbi:MAG TPA: hypothetical protein VH912_21925 [Streptosporangiaceae bacterium]|jgi:hypothetical protein